MGRVGIRLCQDRRARHYQYRAFGVPDLALSRTGTDARVVAPYATLMALPFAREPSIGNLERLARAGAVGRYGFYEAIDYTPAHLPLGRQDMVVRSFMAHHHGMSLLGLCAVLDGSRFVDRFHADVRVQSSEILLYEASADVPALEQGGGEERPTARRAPPEVLRVLPRRVPHWTPAPLVNVLSNGRYTVFLSNAGGGGSRWAGLDLSRWRADATRDAHGVWTYLHDLDSGRLWSATRQPTGVDGQQETVSFQPHASAFSRQVDAILSRLDVTVDPDDDVEIRRLTLTNQGNETRRLAVASYGEVVLAPHGADLRHPAYEGLFVESRWLLELHGTPVPPPAARRQRSRAPPAPPPRGRDGPTRQRGVRERPLALPRPARQRRASGGILAKVLSGTSGAVLDPVYALRTTFVLGAWRQRPARLPHARQATTRRAC